MNPDAFTWCIRTVRTWSFLHEGVNVPVISYDTANQLKDIALSLWHSSELVKDNLDDREQDVVHDPENRHLVVAMPRNVLFEAGVSRVLAPTPR